MAKYPQRKSAIVYGVEAHIGVQQSCLDLLEMDYDVHILVDGIAAIHDIGFFLYKMDFNFFFFR